MNNKITYKILFGLAIINVIFFVVLNFVVLIYYGGTVLTILTTLISLVGGAIVTLILGLDLYRDAQLDEAALNRYHIIIQNKANEKQK